MKYNVEFAYYDPDGKIPFNGIYDDPINDEPIIANSEEEAIEQGWWIADELIERNNEPEEWDRLKEEFRREHIARAILVER